MKYFYCLGVTIDGNYAEKTCKVRDNCQYYLHDLFKRHPEALGEGEMILNEPWRECTCYLPRQEKVEVKEEDNPFAIFMQHV